jgi:hypothetical protein
MSLSDQMKRRGKKQSHERAGEVIPFPVGKKDRVFCLVNDGIYRVHEDAKRKRETGETPTAVDVRCCKATKTDGGKLSHNDAKVEADGNVRGRGYFLWGRCVWKVCHHDCIVWQTSLNDSISKQIAQHRKERAIHQDFRCVLGVIPLEAPPRPA